MPIYEYRCQSCEQNFEVIQKFSDEPLTEHEGCGGTLERLVSPPALQFKGTGWYVTDYARKNGSSPASAKGDTAKPESKSESSGDSKPAPAKTEASAAKSESK